MVPVGHLRNLCGHCGPTVGADGYPLMLTVEAGLDSALVQVSSSRHS